MQSCQEEEEDTSLRDGQFRKIDPSVHPWFNSYFRNSSIPLPLSMRPCVFMTPLNSLKLIICRLFANQFFPRVELTFRPESEKDAEKSWPFLPTDITFSGGYFIPLSLWNRELLPKLSFGELREKKELNLSRAAFRALELTPKGHFCPMSESGRAKGRGPEN